MHHTKDKGDLGVAKAIASLAEQGWIVLTPLTEHAPFDLVVYRDGKFKRVQVKYRALSKGSLEISLRSCWSDKHGIHVKKTDKSLFDILCIYCPDTGQCYYINPALFNQSIKLRLNPPKNGQNLHIRYLKDYTIF